MNDDERFYEEVAAELKTSGPREGLWLKALTATGGDETAAKLQYFKWRVEQLQEDARQKEEALKRDQEQRRASERGEAPESEIIRWSGSTNPKVIESWKRNRVLESWNRTYGSVAPPTRRGSGISSTGMFLIIVAVVVCIGVVLLFSSMAK